MKKKYEVEGVVHKLSRRGVKFGKATKEADASRLGVVGIDTLGKLDFLNSHGYTVYLPARDRSRDAYTQSRINQEKRS